MALEGEARESRKGVEKEYRPIQSPNSTHHNHGSNSTYGREIDGSSAISRSHSRVMNLVRSYSDGHCVSDVEKPRPFKSGPEEIPEKQFEVQWDGDSDPSNPRSRSQARKWLIVLIVSSSSLCVYGRAIKPIETRTEVKPELALLPSIRLRTGRSPRNSIVLRLLPLWA